MTSNFLRGVLSYNVFKNIFETYNSKFLSKGDIQPTGHPMSKAFQALTSIPTQYFASEENKFELSLIEDIKIDSKDIMIGPEKWEVDVETLRALGKPAPFGKADKTVFDPEVRKALEVAADRIEITYNDYQKKSLMELLEDVAPPGKKLEPQLYKLHMYEVGGHFQRHRDTVHAPNHYGTLIVTLPTEYKGGEFILEVDGEQKEFKLNCGKGSYKNPFIVFLTDLPHEVKPVTSGTRVVLQYDLYLVETDKEEIEMVPKMVIPPGMRAPDYSENSAWERAPIIKLGRLEEEKCSSAATVFLKELEDYIAANPEDNISFLLTHEYPLCATFDSLKAGDRLLYDILSKRFNLALGYAVNGLKTDGYGEFEDKGEFLVMNYQCCMEVSKIIETGLESDEKLEEGNVKVFMGNGAKFQQTKMTSYIEYTGNESAEGEYVYASLVLSLGPRL